MDKTMREVKDIIYRTLFGKDTRALLIHFNLPAEYYFDEDDDALMDCMGLLALQAVGEIHNLSAKWLEKHPMHSVTAHALKSNLRDIAYTRAKYYKSLAKEKGADLLVDVRSGKDIEL